MCDNQQGIVKSPSLVLILLFVKSHLDLYWWKKLSLPPYLIDIRYAISEDTTNW